MTSVADVLEPARLAEEAGFDRITTGEYRSDALTWLGALGAATDDVPVATTIASIALRHPTVTAEGVAALRDIHGDRIELGLGVSHETLMVDELGLSQPTLRDLEDYVVAVRSVLAGDPVRNRRYQAPAHDRRRECAGMPPVLVAALGEAAALRAASYADGIILTWSPVGWTRRITDAVRAQDAITDRTTEIWVVLPTFATRDITAGREACADHLGAYLSLSAYRKMLEASTGDPERFQHAIADETRTGLVDRLGPDLLESVAAIGGPEETRHAISATAAAGADAVILYPLDTGSGWREAVDATITMVAPGP
jgi:alkanesulfonate monooxygenase SsuD/methylene tetrahydromethanopterin reductase-like flavin-dependent oxidoreductase (luciferase family)